MNKLTDWLDSLVTRACDWLNALLPAEHPLALAGYGMAGLQTHVLLPVDRRINPTVLMTGHGVAPDGVHPAGTYGVTPFKLDAKADQTKCGFWAYCHISGVPCAMCNPWQWLISANSLRDTDYDITTETKNNCQLVRGNLVGEYAWWGCCKDPSTGKGKFLAFADCCVPKENETQDCAGTDASGGPDLSKWCEAWPDAKNWCYDASGSGPGRTYYCTTVIYYKAGDGAC